MIVESNIKKKAQLNCIDINPMLGYHQDINCLFLKEIVVIVIQKEYLRGLITVFYLHEVKYP